MFCPLGLIDNCIYTKLVFTNSFHCKNTAYCAMVISSWKLPYYYENIDGIKALIVTCTNVESNYQIRVIDQYLAQLFCEQEGWIKAISLDLDRIPY